MDHQPLPQPNQQPQAEQDLALRATPHRPGVGTRLASWLLRGYLRYSPLKRGKYRLLCWTQQITPIGTWVAPGIWMQFIRPDRSDEAEYLMGVYEPDVVHILRTLLRPGMTVFDVGANLGYHMLLCAALVGRQGQVHAFEPTPMLAQALRRHCHANGLAWVHVVQQAVSDQPGHARLLVSDVDAEANSIIGQAHETDDDATVVEVEATTLDHYVEQCGMGRVDLAKIDVEGAELRLLDGAKRLLSASDAPLLVIEFHARTLGRSGHTPADLQQRLESFGYSCHVLPGLMRQDRVAYNVVATKPEHQRRFDTLSRLRLTPLPRA